MTVLDDTHAMSRDTDPALRQGVRRALQIVICVVLMETIGDLFRFLLPPGWHHVIGDGLDVVAILAVISMYRQVVRYVQSIADAHRELRASEAELHDANAELRASEELRQDLVAMLVHDLKNPLGAARGAIEAVTTGPGSGRLRPRDIRLLEMAGEAHERLDGMIGDLLVISRAEQDCLRLECSDVDVAEISTRCVLRLQTAAEAGGIEVVTDAQPSRVHVDAPKIQRVIENLLANAVKFTPKGGVIAVQADAGPERLSLAVSDTGPGVAPEDRERIFEKYGQAIKQPGARASVGLGLTFCKHVVEAHGGRIWVEDAPGGGSVFRVDIPMREQPPPAPPDQS